MRLHHGYLAGCLTCLQTDIVELSWLTPSSERSGNTIGGCQRLLRVSQQLAKETVQTMLPHNNNCELLEDVCVLSYTQTASYDAKHVLSRLFPRGVIPAQTGILQTLSLQQMCNAFSQIIDPW